MAEQVKELELSNQQLQESVESKMRGMNSLVQSVVSLREEEKEFTKLKAAERNRNGGNDSLHEKRKELDYKIQESKEVEKQINYIKRTFKQDSNYEWMIETEKRIRSDRTTIAKLREENASLNKMVVKHEKLLDSTETEVAGNNQLENMENQVAELEHKTRGIVKKLKDEEKKYLEQHESLVNCKDRCRKM